MQSPDNHNARRNLSAIVDFSNNINSNLNLEFACNNLLLTCFGKLLVTKGIIALFDENGKIKICLSKGINPDKINSFPEFDIKDENFELIEEFSSEFGFGLVERIVSSDQLLGYILLGDKLNKEGFTNDDREFFSTILKIGSTTIRNALSFDSLTRLNKMLDSKINQLNSIFDLGKEFSGILEIKRVSKLLVYAVSAQMLISKYAIVIYDSSGFDILESKYDNNILKRIIESDEIKTIDQPIIANDQNEFCRDCKKFGIALIVPMTIKSEKKGIIFLGNRITKQIYSKSDIEYISSIASFAIISIENARLFKEALEKQKLEKDLEIARNIQNNLLPKEIPQSDIYKISAINRTARKVGGDFYDVVKLDDKRILLAIADVSGKGIQASLLMANLQAFLKSIYKQNYTLQEASNFLNDLVSENTTNGSFITFFWGILDIKTKKFTYVNMGHNPPILLRKNEIIKLKKGGMILGVMKTVIPYEYEEIELNKGDMLILFTDGITEAMNSNNQEYGDSRFEELSLNHAGEPPEKFLEIMLEDMNQHTAGAEQSDDITTLILKMN